MTSRSSNQTYVYAWVVLYTCTSHCCEMYITSQNFPQIIIVQFKFNFYELCSKIVATGTIFFYLNLEYSRPVMWKRPSGNIDLLFVLLEKYFNWKVEKNSTKYTNNCYKMLKKMYFLITKNMAFIQFHWRLFSSLIVKEEPLWKSETQMVTLYLF